MAKKRQRQPISRQADDLFDSLTAPKVSPESPQTTTRRKRSDYQGTPSRKRDYHQGTKMLGVRVPDEIAAEIQRRVEAGEATSVNAWLLDLILTKLKKR